MRSRASRTWSCPENEVTPQGLYVRRREFLRLGAAGALGWAGAAMAISCKAAAKDNPASGLPPFKRGPFATEEKQTPLDDVTSYNNYYEFGTAKERSRPKMLVLQDQALDDLVRRRNQEAADRRHRRSS